MRLKLEFYQTHIQTLLPADFLLHPVNFYYKSEREGRGIKVSFLLLFSLVSVDLTLDVYCFLRLLPALSEPAVFHLLRDTVGSQMLPLSRYHGHPSLRFSGFYQQLGNIVSSEG